MAQRPVFMAHESAPYSREWTAVFEFFPGFSVAQKRRNIQAIHDEFHRAFPGKKVLEISSKSMQEGGEALSAFFLKKHVPSLGRAVPVENVFQAGKILTSGGPYTDLLNVTPREAKRDERLKDGRITGFMFEGKRFPRIPLTLFYDFIYINALLENEELAKVALEYDAFTDVEFNPAKSLNCQARAAAMYVSLVRAGLEDAIRDTDAFSRLYG